MFLFDKLDVEERLSSSYTEKRLALTVATPPPDCPSPTDDDDDDDGALLIGDSAQRVASLQYKFFLIDFQETILKTLHKDLMIADETDTLQTHHRWHDLIAFDVKSSELIGALAKRPLAEKFFSFTPAQLSLLVPKVRFFLVKYINSHASWADLSQTARGKKKVQLEEESNTELKFDDHVRTSLVEDIMKTGKGRAYGIGLKNFEYEFDGKDFATTEKSVKVNVELVFTDFSALTEEQGGKGGPRWLDLLLRTKKMIPQHDYRKTWQQSANVLNFCRTPKEERDASAQDSTLVLNPRYRRIRVTCGWATPPDTQLFTPQERNLIKDLHLSFFLEMTNYRIDFKNDGTVSLKIEYRASAEGELSEPNSNIFYMLNHQVQERLASQKEKIKQRRKERNAKIDEIESGNMKGKCDDPKKDKQRIKDEYEEIITKQQKQTNTLLEMWKLQHYRLFITNLLARHKIMFMDIEASTMVDYRSLQNFNPRPGILERPSKEYSEARSAGAAAPRDRIKKEITRELEQNTGRGGGGPQDEMSMTTWYSSADCEIYQINKEIRAEQEKHNAIGSGAPQPGPQADLPPHEACAEWRRNEADAGDTYRINFLFMGDLFDLAMHYVNALNPTYMGLEPGIDGTNVRLCTSLIEFTDFQGNVKHLNIADIPVSLDLFIIFWRDNVIKRRRTNYTALHFIKDLMNDVFFKALGDACYGGRGAPVPALSTTVIETSKRGSQGWKSDIDSCSTSPAKPTLLACEPIPRDPGIFQGYDAGGSALEGFRTGNEEVQMNPGTPRIASERSGPVIEYKFPRIPKKRLKEIAKRFVRTYEGERSTSIVHYYILHGAQRNFIARTADKAKDEREGIYHLGLGLDRGIVKEIKFEAAELKYAAEARTIYDGVDGLGQLFNKFNATVELFGCPIFRNGQYVFLDPKTMGVESEIARTIGLGGYYNIFNVVGEISSGGYTTKLKCMYNSSGVCPDTEKEKAEEPLEWPDDLKGMSPKNREKAIADLEAKEEALIRAETEAKEKAAKANEEAIEAQRQKSIVSMMNPGVKSAYQSKPSFKADMDACLASTNSSADDVQACGDKTWYKHVTLPAQVDASKNKGL